MEKIALKNTQVGGGANTYELLYDTPRQLIASYSEYNEINAEEVVSLNLTSQRRILESLIPFDIRLSNIVLYFSQGNEQSMQIILASASILKEFSAPIGDGNVIIVLDDALLAEGEDLRMDIRNVEPTEINPSPILRGWCLTYNIPSV